MMIMITVVSLIILVLYVCIHFNEKSRRIDRMFPGPFRLPIIGTSSLNLMRKNSNEEAHNDRSYRLWFGNKPYIIIPDDKAAKKILSQLKFTDKAEAYDAFAPFLGKNHLLGKGEVWLRYRKHAVQAFSSKELSRYLKIFNRNCDALCQTLQKHVNNDSVNIQKYIIPWAMDNLAEALSGEEWQTGPDDPLLKALTEISEIINRRMKMPVFGIDWIFRLTPLNSLQKKSIEVVRYYSRNILRRKRESIETTNDNIYTGMEDQSLIQDALSHFIKSNQFSDEEIESEIASTMFAGVESVSTTLCFALYLLAEHQDIQEKVYEETKAIIEESEGWPNMNDVNKMVYTEQVLNETLRCYSPFGSIGRRIQEDLHINEHQFIPKNTDVFISLSKIHKDPKNWPDPHVFDPDRFSPENTRKRDPSTFVPFSAGPRKCLGNKYAMVEMKMGIAEVIQKFKLSPSPKPEDKIQPVRNMGLTITSSNGFNIILHQRDQ